MRSARAEPILAPKQRSTMSILSTPGGSLRIAVLGARAHFLPDANSVSDVVNAGSGMCGIDGVRCTRMSTQ
jgi:hypothetical protein